MTTCCPCDEWIFPPEPVITAGLSRLPRQVIGFPEYRRALLSGVRAHAPLSDWRAREGDDLGLMMLEWWAYVFDVVTFYDGEIAQNIYLRTARDLGAVRRLTGLIGYTPRPGVAAEALIAAIAAAGPDTLVPLLTAFRSEAFASEPPQVFESDAEKIIAPRLNRWVLAPQRKATVPTGTRHLFELSSLRLVRGAWCIVTWPGHHRIRRIADVKPALAVDGVTYAEVTTDPTFSIGAGVDLADVGVQMPTASAGINRIDDAPVTTTTILLDAIYPQIAPGQQILLISGSEKRLRTVDSVAVVEATPPSGSTLPVLPATQITLDSALPTSWTTATDIAVHFQFVDGGALARPAEIRLQRDDLNPSVALDGVVEPLDEAAGGPFLLQDRDKAGAQLDGTVSVTDQGAGTLAPSSDATPFSAALIPPVEVFGNLIHVVRGETVAHEVLGSGDATVTLPSFKLKKKPLTYVAKASAPNGRASTLEVSVNGIMWREVPSFYGTNPDDPVYIVRSDEEQNSIVTFWKLPSGIGNVTARYRFGAGAAKPPANTLSQIVRPVKGLSRVLNPVMAFGGADPDLPEDIRANAPASALTLGRAVSLADFEALARSFGVVNVSAGWAWDAGQQRAVVKLWYIADGGDISQPLTSFLIGQADPNIRLVAAPATAVPTALVIDVVTDERFDSADVQAALIAALADPKTGMLAHANTPIGGSVFRSALCAAALAVPGVAAINGMTVNGSPVPMALSAGEGAYLDFIPFTNL